MDSQQYSRTIGNNSEKQFLSLNDKDTIQTKHKLNLSPQKIHEASEKQAFAFIDNHSLLNRSKDIETHLEACHFSLKATECALNGLYQLKNNVQRAQALITMAKTSNSLEEMKAFFVQFLHTLSSKQSIIEGCQYKGQNLLSGNFNHSIVLAPFHHGLNVTIPVQDFSDVQNQFFDTFFQQYRQFNESVETTEDMHHLIILAENGLEQITLKIETTSELFNEKILDIQSIRHFLMISNQLITAASHNDSEEEGAIDEHAALSSMLTIEHPAIVALIIAMQKENSVLKRL